MKKFLLFVILLTPFLLAAGQNLPRQQHFNLSFFNHKLPCTKTGKELSSGEFSCYIGCNNKPYEPSDIIGTSSKKLSYYIGKKKRTPMERALFLRKYLELTPEEQKMPGNSTTIYQCPNSQTVLLEQRYGEEFYQIYQLSPGNKILHWRDSCGESGPMRDYKMLFSYMCALSGKDISNTHQFPPINTSAHQNVTSPNTPLGKNHSTNQNKQNLQDIPTTNAWYVLGDYFYPAPAPDKLSSIRRFETKNKAKEIKINFSSKDKKPFLEKLKNAHRYHPARQTDCADGSILYETVADGLYQTFLLRPNATAVFTASYTLPTLPEEPYASKLQKGLCALDIDSKW